MGATQNEINDVSSASQSLMTKAQSGQAIILIALAMVGLLGFTGLALDGGSLLFLQRKAQTVAEMAAMSAAVVACRDGGATDSQIQAEAIRVAGLPGNDVASSMLNPQPVVSRTGDWTDVAVKVRMPKPSYFIQVVYKEALFAEGYSVARCSGDASTVANPYADAVMFATSEHCPNTLVTEGGGMIYKGSLRSNRDAYLNASSGGPASTPTVTITGTLNFVTEATGNRDLIWNANPPRIGGYYSMSIAGQLPLNNSNPNDTSDAGILQGPVQAAPLLYEIEDFRPNGEIWNSIPENRRTYIDNRAGRTLLWNICSNPDSCYQVPTRDGKIQGLYFVEGDFIATGTGAIMNAMIGDGITIVATGRILVTGPAFHMTPYYDNLQMMSGFGASGGYQSYTAGQSITTGGNCGNDGDAMGGSNAISLPPGGGANTLVWGTEQRPGLLYAPWGRVYMGTGDIGASVGQIIAYAISSHQSHAAIYYGPTASGVSSVSSPLDVYFIQ